MSGKPIGVPTATTSRFLVMAVAAMGSASFASRLTLVSTGVDPALASLVGPAALLVATVLVYLGRVFGCDQFAGFALAVAPDLVDRGA
ncbi:hypothetical protein ACFVFS_19450 [Kitasatospora sp. NPDC057692]|uniref:hypothetical protein n=1 Tax=Kitasatospora sp. NPDC057692 TaxID=3346215 RepID=UPI00367FE369